ncbi:MAG TPA: hypothetical protein VK471_07480 [Solirubrobacterales bacterium]|nr:hypothetical protein [Solirubrobacterales bacterium]
MSGESQSQRGVPAETLEQARVLLAEALKISRPWALVVVVAVVVSAFDVSHEGGSGWTIGFQISSTTVLLLSLMWLPGLIRVIAMTGVNFKTAAGEATTSGLLGLLKDLSPDAKREALPSVIAAFDMVAAEKPEERHAARRARDDLESQLVAAEPEPGDPKEVLQQYGREYEQLRAEMDPGPERTFQMNSLLAEARAAAKAAQLSGDEIRNFFASDRVGLRLMAIASLQVSPDISVFAQLLDAIANSRSAFEQYHALAAARDHVPLMSGNQRRELRKVLKHQLNDPVKGIEQDGSRHREVQALLAEL